MTRFILLGATFLTLSACTGVKEQLGLGRNVPDAFKVVTREPLELPADTAALPPPRPGAPRPQEAAVPRRAAETLIGTAGSQGAPSAAETSLLQQAGAFDGPDNIRELVDGDSRVDPNNEVPLGRRLLGLGPDSATDQVIDPAAERERLEEAQPEGQGTLEDDI